MRHKKFFVTRMPARATTLLLLHFIVGRSFSQEEEKNSKQNNARKEVKLVTLLSDPSPSPAKVILAPLLAQHFTPVSRSSFRTSVVLKLASLFCQKNY